MDSEPTLVNSNNSTYESTLFKVLSFLAYKPRTRSEIEKKARLLCKDDLDLFACVINRIVELGYIDDLAYAKKLFKEKTRLTKPFSKSEIARFLKSKGVESEDVEQILITNYDDVLEYSLIKAILEKRSRKNKDTKKNTSYLLGRGFSYQVITQVLRQLEDVS